MIARTSKPHVLSWRPRGPTALSWFQGTPTSLANKTMTDINESLAPTSVSERRHDLDALRAAAMLLGIAYHAALSLSADSPWFVEDSQQSSALYYMEAASHGFRMPLFFVISGFFTAWLCQKRGLRGLWVNRFQRILLPCLLGLVTIVPLTNWSVGRAMQQSQGQGESASAQSDAGIWSSIARGDVVAVQAWLVNDGASGAQHPEFGTSPLSWAALNGQIEIVQVLIDGGIDVQQKSRDGSTALHAACFVGQDRIVELLSEAGADWKARDAQGGLPLGAAEADWGTTQWLTSLLRLPVDRATVEAGRRRILDRWPAQDPTSVPGHEKSTANDRSVWAAVYLGLIYIPVFAHLWFLWFLCWLGLGFSLVWALSRTFAQLIWRAPLRVADWRWVYSPLGGAVVVTLTLWPQSQMGLTNAGFGPDTSTGLLPMPHVLLYYGIFFGFGALYFASHDRQGRLGSGWRWTLPTGLLILFPLALEFSTGHWGWGERLLPTRYHTLAGTLLQAWFAWQMSWGSIGMFHSLFGAGRSWVRYLSDASYWLYVAHMPLVVLGQMAIRDVPVPAMVKWLGLTLSITVGLLVIYEYGVRYSWLGRLLNGRRVRPAQASSP